MEKRFLLIGALFGFQAIPASLRSKSDQANRRDFGDIALVFADTIRKIHQKDAEVFDNRRQCLGDDDVPNKPHAGDGK